MKKNLKKKYFRIQKINHDEKMYRIYEKKIIHDEINFSDK